MENTAELFGLSPRDIQTIHDVFSQYTDIETVLIFGSRATGSFKPGSDIDLAIMNSVPSRIMLNLINDFEESSLPFKIDLIDFSSLSNPALSEHIQKAGIVFYNRPSSKTENPG